MQLRGAAGASHPTSGKGWSFPGGPSPDLAGRAVRGGRRVPGRGQSQAAHKREAGETGSKGGGLAAGRCRNGLRPVDRHRGPGAGERPVESGGANRVQG